MKQILVIIIVIVGVAGLLAYLRGGEEKKAGREGVVDTVTQGLKQARDLNRQSHTADLSGQGLASFPWEVLERTNIKVLNLSGNHITSLPSEIGKLTNLEELYLSDNRLTGALPAEIRQFQRLRILDARHNQLTGIPAEIGQLKNLTRLDFSGNRINTYPNEFANLKDTLQSLNLTGNPFTPAQITELKTMLPKTDISF